MTPTDDAEHQPTLVHYEHRHTIPAEVCGTCSSIKEGVLVDVMQCPEARAQMTDDPASSYAAVVILPRDGAAESSDTCPYGQDSAHCSLAKGRRDALCNACWAELNADL